MTTNRQTIAFIGADETLGPAIAKKLSRTTDRYRLLLLGRKPDILRRLADEIRSITPDSEIETMSCQHTASWEADIIMIAGSDKNQKEIAEKIRDVATQKTVISLAAPVHETADGRLASGGETVAAELQKILPHSKVVRTFDPDI